MSDDNVQIISLTHHQNLLEAMRILQRSGRLCDITVEVDFQGKSQEYDTHRLVLAATSGYFKNLLLANDSLRKAPLNDLPPAEFDAFLEYAYTGQVEVARTFIPNILKTAVFLDCTDLVDACKAVTDLQATKSETGAPPDTKAVVKSPQRRQVKGRGRPPSKTSARIETSIDSQELQEPGHKGRRLSHRLACRDNPAGTPESKRPRRGRPRAGESCKKKGPQDGAGEKGEQTDPASPVDMDQEGVSSHEDQSSVSDNTSLTSDDEIQEDPKDKDFCLEEKVAEEEGEEEEGEESEKTIESGTSRVTFQCEKCERSFLYQKSFLKHMRVAHGEQPEVTHRCGTCHQTFANRGNLKIHEQHVHSEERLYPCDVCTKAFKRSKDVRRHKRQVHDGGERHHCAECSKTLSSRTALKLHQRTHTGYRPYECPECGAKFSQTSALKTHLRIHTGEKPYACDECDARFTQKHMLAYHKRSHTGEKPFMCENCGKSFASKEYLKHHARIHSGSRPYKCDVCDRAFAQRNSLHQHMKTHTGERPYECTSCEKRFTQLNALQRHQRIHTGEKPYMCTLCNRTFTDKSTLRRHAMTHDKETPWRNYLMVLENNVEDPTKKTRAPNTPTKKDQAPSKEGPPTSKSPKSTNVAMTTTVTTVTPAATVTGDPVTLAAEWGGPGTITLVSHGTLGGFTVIQTEGGGASQLQPLVTADGTPVTVPLALPITVSHPSGSVRPSGTSAASAFPIAVPVSVAKALTHVQMPAGPAAILAPVGTVDVASSAELEAAMAAGEIQCVTVDNGEQVVETEETAKVEGSPVQLISDDGAQVAETTVTMEVTTSTISEEPSQ